MCVCVIVHVFVLGYTCALQKDILYQGRLFVSDNWICFQSKVFGKDTKVGDKVARRQETQDHKVAERQETQNHKVARRQETQNHKVARRQETRRQGR